MDDNNETVKLENIRIDPSATKSPVLIVLQGDSLGTSISLASRSVTIGRGADCDVRLDDNLASRLHARVAAIGTGNVYSLYDLGSTNGTFINGQLVEDPCALMDGDKIRVGKHVFKFTWLDEYESEFQQRIQQMIIRDDLTNLLTQRSFFVELERQINRRNGQADVGTIAVLMMDLDHFKNVNDTYGHLVGSQTIKVAGELIQEHSGATAVVSRYGGEEFIAFLPDVTLEHAAATAEQIRAAVAGREIVAARKGTEIRLKITISIGVSWFPVHGKDPVDLIERADLALYRAKTAGRNRVCAYDPRLDRFDEAGYQRLDLSQMLDGQGSLE